jgi:hypothetical protein
VEAEGNISVSSALNSSLYYIYSYSLYLTPYSYLTQVSSALNSSLYYIYSAIRADWDYGISPGGLAEDSYDGRSFWDCETW